MCMNCGCGLPHEDHDDPANITADGLKRAADANDQSMRETAQHILETVELLDASRRDDRGRGLAEPAGPGGAHTGERAARGTPATES